MDEWEKRNSILDRMLFCLERQKLKLLLNCPFQLDYTELEMGFLVPPLKVQNGGKLDLDNVKAHTSFLVY